MGFLKKLMKNPIVQMALPVALGYAAGPLFGALGKGSGLFANMSPLMANALKQSALGYGTAALTGAKDPAKAAMYAGLTSIPWIWVLAPWWVPITITLGVLTAAALTGGE